MQILKKPSIVQKKMRPHMKAFGLFLNEIEIGTSGGRQRSPKWLRSRHKKIGPKMLKSSIFKLQKCNTPQKKAGNNRHLDLK